MQIAFGYNTVILGRRKISHMLPLAEIASGNDYKCHRIEVMVNVRHERDLEMPKRIDVTHAFEELFGEEPQVYKDVLSMMNTITNQVRVNTTSVQYDSYIEKDLIYSYCPELEEYRYVLRFNVTNHN